MSTSTQTVTVAFTTKQHAARDAVVLTRASQLLGTAKGTARHLLHPPDQHLNQQNSRDYSCYLLPMSSSGRAEAFAAVAQDIPLHARTLADGRDFVDSFSRLHTHTRTTRHAHNRRHSSCENTDTTQGSAHPQHRTLHTLPPRVCSGVNDE